MLKKNRIASIIAIVVLVGLGILLCFLWRSHAGEVGRIFASPQALHQFIQGFGIWAPLIFVLLQAAQIVVPFIPGNITTLAGGALFGAIPGFLLSGTGLIIGSLIAFYLARRFGQNLVINIVGQQQFDKYNVFFNSKSSLSLVILFLVPFSPADILCFVFGLSSMSWRTFLFIQLFGRLPKTLIETLIGSRIMTFSLWQWIIFGAISLLLAVVLIKYSNQLEQWLYRRIMSKRTA